MILLYNITSFIHSVFCLTSGPKPPPKRCRHIVRSRASSFKWEYPLLSLRLYSSFLRLLPRLLATSISPFIFSSITCFRRQFLRKMWPIQLAFRFLISCRIFLCSLTLSNNEQSNILHEIRTNKPYLLWVNTILYFAVPVDSVNTLQWFLFTCILLIYPGILCSKSVCH